MFLTADSLISLICSNCSILENAEISSSKLIGLKDEMIVNQKILDYSASLAHSSQRDISQNSIITNKNRDTVRLEYGEEYNF